MEIIDGISASPGIALGKALIYLEEIQTVPQYAITLDMVETEFSRFTTALALAVGDIELIMARDGTKDTSGAADMLTTHLLMLQDPDFSDRVQTRLSESLLNVEFIISQIMKELIQKLSLSKDEYLRARTADLHDVSRRVLNHLVYKERKDLANLDEEIILVCHDLLPSEAITMDKVKVRAIAMDAGGKTSHTAILARAFEIPAVLGLGTAAAHLKDGQMVIVDGSKGRFIIDPDQGTIDTYTALKREHERREVRLMGLSELPAETKDGKLILLKANIEIPEEVDAAISHGADGIGLFRSEFLFLKAQSGLPDEEEQFRAYRHVLVAMGARPVTIRTLDIGGDKMLRNMNLQLTNEKNPILGWRAIRFCLAHEDLFRTQLRAMLRASVHGKLRIMFPLISGLDELGNALTILEEVRSDLRRRKIPFAEDVPVGTMIEVPSAALISDLLGRKSQFFSIGTNDLIQYTIAVDRGNEHTAYLYDPLHPAVLRFLRMIVENGHKNGLPVGMCGEMAGDPLYTMVLLGLGLDEFSMSALSVPEVKRIIRSTTLAEAEEFVGKLMRMTSSSEIEDLVRGTMEDRFEISNY